MGCGPCNNEKQVIYNDIKRYKKDIDTDLKSHMFDNGNGSFLGKICKENNLTDRNIAQAWLDLYISFMVILGWNTEPPKSKKMKKKELDKNQYLCLPYEILQVWRCHVLYSKNYSDFCNKITQGRNKFIEFVPPLQVWKFIDIETVQKSFSTNNQFIENTCSLPKNDIKALFIFQSAYLKNTLSFNIIDGSPITNIIVSRMEAELKKSNGGIFNLQTRDVKSLGSLSQAIDSLILSCISQEMLPPVQEWQIGMNISQADRNKAVNFQNIQFPEGFTFFFSRSHLICSQRAEHYIDEYKKYMYLSAVTGIEQTPSEEVDQVWHYHITYTENYKQFSSQKMGIDFFHHNPADGTTHDDNKYRGVYQNTMNGIISFFGNINQYAWPPVEVRFSQSYRWYSHPDFIRRCSVWQQSQVQKSVKTKNVKTVYIGGGCYVGCGYYRGYYGCSMWIGCGGIGYGCGVGWHGYGCGIGHGCAAAMSGCGGVGCGGGGNFITLNIIRLRCFWLWGRI